MATLNRGVTMTRVLLAALSDARAIPAEILSQPDGLYQELYGIGSQETTAFPQTISSDLARCRIAGAAAYETVGKLMKWGLKLAEFLGIDVHELFVDPHQQ